MEGQKSRFPFTRFYGMTTCQISPGPHVDVLHFSAAGAAELSRNYNATVTAGYVFLFLPIHLVHVSLYNVEVECKIKNRETYLTERKKKEKKERTVDKLTNELGPFCSLLQYLPVSFCLPF